LLLDTYQNIISETAAKGIKSPANICVPLMKQLADECALVYNIIPAIVCIYLGEALLSAGMTDEGKDHFKKSLQNHPNSIPLQVYNYRLIDDPNTKKEELKKLKKKYPGHWM